jgi:hypothetical protein
MRSFLAEYEEGIRNLYTYDIPTQQTATSRSSEVRLSITPIVRDSFNQRSPYWNDCPVLDYGGHKSHAPTGCVATAMAQVMATFRHPTRTKEIIPSYEFTFDGKLYTIPSIAGDSVIHWENIQHKYNEEYHGTPEEDAVAALMSMCGTATQMNYGVNELGGSMTTADKAAEALVRYFDYEERTVRLVYRREYSYSRWDDMIYNELKSGRPVIYSGLSADNGHTFICDGYNAEDDTYHINWGWGGLAEGWYSLRLLKPSSIGIGGGTDLSGYGMAQSAIIGIQPNDTVNTPKPTVLTVNYLYTQDYQKIFSRSDNSKDFTGMNIIYEAWNWSGGGNTFDLGLRIIDCEGNTIQEIVDTRAQGRSIINNGRWYTKRPGEEYAVPVNISSSLPDGDYKLIATSRITGSGSMNPDVDSDSRCILFSIVGNNLYVTDMFQEPRFGLLLANDIEIEPVKKGENMAGRLHSAKAVLINNGTTYRDDIFYTLNETNPESTDKNIFYATFIELREGESETFYFYFKPNQQGENIIRLYAKDDWGTLQYLGMQVITVTGAPEIKLYVTDIDNYDTEEGAVIGNNLKITVKLANEGSTAFTGKYDVFLSYSDDQGANWIDIQYSYPTIFSARTTWEMTIGAGESVERLFQWTNLNYQRYHRILFAKNDNGYYYDNDMIRTEDIRLIDPTDIKNMAANTDNSAPIYSLQGIRVVGNGRHLQPGLYVRNGRKFFIK